MRKMRENSRILLPAVVGGLLGVTTGAHAQPDLTGTWSDPPPRAEDAFCHVGCTVEGRDYLTQLLDDPANDSKSYRELRGEAQRFQREEVVPRHLTAEARERYPFDNRADPSLTQCAPWGFTREILSPHAMQLTQHDNRVTLYYSEWTAERTAWLDDREPPNDYAHTLLGFSTGYYDSETLVVETTGVTANHSNAGFMHSDQLTSVERFTRSQDGERLDLEVTFSDPQTFVTPIVMARAWTWAPGEEIYPYDACETPDE